MQAEPRPEKKKRPRFALSLCAALATHAFLFAVLPRMRVVPPDAGEAQEPMLVDLIDAALDAPPPAPEAPAPAAEAPADRPTPAEPTSPGLAKAATLDKRPQVAETEAPSGPAEVAALGGGGSSGVRVEGGEAAPRGPLNFGLGPLASRAFTTSPTASAAEAPRPPPPDPAERARQYLSQAQDDHDRELGLGWGGEVATAARSGVVRDATPGGEGQAVIEVELDANGVAVSARVRSSSSQSDGWRRVADALLAALRGRTVKGLEGSRGGRIALRLETRERLPSGSDSVAKQCGLGVCGDLADIGAQKLRTVNVRLERKERL